MSDVNQSETTSGSATPGPASTSGFTFGDVTHFKNVETYLETKFKQRVSIQG